MSRVYDLDGHETARGWRKTSLSTRPGEVTITLRARDGLEAECLLRDPRQHGDASVFVGGLAISSSCWGGDPDFWQVVYDRICSQQRRVWWHLEDGSDLNLGGEHDRCLSGALPPSDDARGATVVLALRDALLWGSLIALAAAPAALLLLALASVGVWLCRRPRLAIGPWLTSLALFAGAFLLRWLVPFHASIHENHHGYHYINTGVDLVYGISPFGVPSTTLGLAALANLLLPANPEWLFLINALLSAAAVVGLFHLAAILYRSRLAAWTTALLLLFLPVAIGLAPTEEFLVSATGLFLCGAPLVLWGLERSSPRAFLAGLVLLVLAASVRDIAILLAAAIPLLLMIAPRSDVRSRWFSWPVGLGLPFLMLAPRLALVALTHLFVQYGMSSGVVGVPRLAGLLFGAEAGSSFVPNWLVWLAALALVTMAIHAYRTSSWRLFFATFGLLVVCRLEAGFVVGGWFPSRLRHHLLAFSLLPLPVGWLVAEADRRLGPPRFRRQAIVVALVALGGLANLVASPDGVRFDLPGVREYTFFRDTLRAQEVHAQALVLDDPSRPVPAITEGWIRAMRPGWSFLSLEAWKRGERGDPKLPTYVLFDRTCFSNVPCHLHPEACGAFVGTPLGQMVESCADVWRVAGWTIVAKAREENADGTTLRHIQPTDLPGLDPSYWIAVARR